MHLSSLLVALFALLSLVIALPLVLVDDDACIHSDEHSTTSLTPVTSPLSAKSPNSFVAASSDSASVSGGVATYFYQNGNAGACGQVHSDNDLICAIDQARFGTSGPGSSLCGRQVRITNTENGITVTVTVADDCPTCDNSNSIDLSIGAFSILSNNNLSEGEFPIEWSLV